MANERQEEEGIGSGAKKEAESPTRAAEPEKGRPARAQPQKPFVMPSTRRLPDPESINSIWASRERSRDESDARASPEANAAPSKSRSTESAAPEAEASDRPSAGTTATDPWALPHSVRDRFIEVKHRFYFQDGTRAFRDHGRRLTTGSENTEVIKSLIDIAKTRGWEEITVEGTERFRREAWREGYLAGLNVRGYRAAEPERAALVRAMARRAGGEQMELGVAGGGSERPDRAAATAQEASSAQAIPHSRESQPTQRADLLTGKLIDHGRESYRFDPKEPMSYFVEVETREGKRTIWGKDLERAIKESLSKPQIGDEIALRRTGADRVTVQRKDRDEKGEVTGEHAVGAARNRWVLEKREFLDSRAAAAQVLRNPTVDRRQAAREHPELVGTYLQLRAAELAAKRIRDPLDQKKFVALVRSSLADAVARGEPLQPVRLRNRSNPVPERKAREREPGPVRS
ncbi:MAG: LPD7 domain-containing protein [Steroidobacteraceae bacterium]